MQQRPKQLDLEDIENLISGFKTKVYLWDGHTINESHIFKGSVKEVITNEFSLFICEQTIHVFISNIGNLKYFLDYLDKHFLCNGATQKLKETKNEIFKKYTTISNVLPGLMKTFPGKITIVDENTLNIHKPFQATSIIDKNRNLFVIPKEHRITYTKATIIFNSDLMLVSASIDGPHSNQHPKTKEFCLGTLRFKKINETNLNNLYAMFQVYNIFNCYHLPTQIKTIVSKIPNCVSGQ